MTNHPSAHSERGTALLTVLLMLTLALAMLGGFMSTLTTDQQLRGVDQSRTKVFYATHGALERLTADLGNLFITDFAPSAADVQALATTAPSFDQVIFQRPDGSSGYTITPLTLDAQGNPDAVPLDIKSGPFQGFVGLATDYSMNVTGRSASDTGSSAEVRLERELQTVAIPVFQFGIFSETDLSFFAGPNFNFGGRVHTNGNLFLAEGVNNTLTLSSPVTAVKEVVRTNLSNGFSTSSQYPGTVRIARAPNSYRNLTSSEGSLVGTLGSSQNSGWTNLSITSYNGYLRNARTGARKLELPFVTLGATPIDLIRRGRNGENAQILAQRYYQLASMRILLSDNAADITGLPGVTLAAPVSLEAAAAAGSALAQSEGPNQTQTTVAVAASTAPAAWPTATVTVGSTAGFPTVGQIVVSIDAAETNRVTLNYTGKTATTFTGVSTLTGTATPAIANTRWVRSPYKTPAATPLLGGFIKIELQRTDQTWQDVTADVLGLGISSRNLTGSPLCNEPAPNAVLRMQRIRDYPVGGANAAAAGTARCGNGSAAATDYWPNTLYDTREGNARDNVATGDLNMRLGGVMHYIELDVNNLRRYFAGLIGANGGNARNVNGYTIYFSDRRTNRDPATNLETGEYGFEDFVNPNDANGTSNNVLDGGEDVNDSTTLQTYGQNARVVAGSAGVLQNTARPWTLLTSGEARANRAVLFRRALKLTQGTLGNLPMPGLTVAAENPVYVEGNYNANGAGFGNPDSASAVIADAVTLLSNGWNDRTSFIAPNNPTGRAAQTTWYRMAVLAGKGRSFTQPTAGAPPQDYGTDGGAHNFLRFLEAWDGQTLNFRGAIASFYYNRQAVGTYKCCDTVYHAPTRGYNFDTNFLTPALLPPFTPMFRDVNITKFSEVIE